MDEETGLDVSDTSKLISPASRFWKNDPGAVPEHYINRYVISEGPSEVTLALGTKYFELGLGQDLCRVRLVMTHDQFVEFAAEVRKEADFLLRLYNGQPASLRGVSRDEYNRAVEDIYVHEYDTDTDEDDKQF